MKTPYILFISLLILLTSCEKEDVAVTMRKEAASKFIGKWQLDKKVEQLYQPIPDLKTTNTYVGLEEDHFVFKKNDYVDIYSAASTPLKELYGVVNPYQVVFRNDSWRIERLNQEEIILVLDRYNSSENKRNLTTLFLRRLPD